MKISHYCIIVPDSPEKDQRILFSTITGVAVVISKTQLEMLQADPAEWLKSLSQDRRSFFMKNFVVGDLDQEKKRILAKLLDVKNNPKTLTLTILTTMDCNLACVYCHEDGFKKPIYMNKEVAVSIANWIASEVTKHGYKTVYLYFYGGEPLMNFSAIENIVLACEKWASSHNVKLLLDMSTNGILLTEKVALKLRNLGFRSVQISLDGPPAVHNVRRPLKSSEKGSFDQIFNNIKEIRNILRILIRTNVDSQNYDSLPKLMDILVENNLTKEVDFYLDMVAPTHSGSCHCKQFAFKTTEEMMKLDYLWKEQEKRKIRFLGKTITDGLCGVFSSGFLTIDPEGYLYLCTGFVGIKEMVVGNVKSGFYQDIYEKIRMIEPWQGCLDCKYVPICAGGCRAQASIKYSSCAAKDCKKAFYDYAFPLFLRHRFAGGSGGGDDQRSRVSC
jgi:uncharacterized protein